MPTRTTDTQLFEGEYIKCAKMVIDEPCSWKAAQVVSFGTNYEFQMAIKASADTTITIQVGDSSETLDVTTDWQRYAISFPNVTIAESTSLYILFPIGTYWIYNMQLERAKTPSSWRPAPEDAEDYADQAAKQAVDAQTQLDVFNKLTNNGTVQGIYLLDGQLYINGEYIAANTVNANVLSGGTIKGVTIDIGDGVFTVDENGQVTASNMNITGGSLIVESDWTVNQAIIDLYAMYNGVRYETIMRPRNVMARIYTDDNNWRSLSMAYDGLLYQQRYNGTVTELFNLTMTGFIMKSANGKQAKLYDSSANNAITLELYDNNGQRRVQLSERGLFFTNADGTAGNAYRP